MQAQLKVARGSSSGKAFPIEGKQFIIGRATGCNLRPQSDAISRQHCAFIVKDDQLFVKDLGSRNGTFVNEEQLTEAVQVQSGDLVRVGPLVLEVDLSHSGEATQVSTDTVNVADTPTTSESDENMDTADDDLISDWLEDMDGGEPAEKTTREFSLDATVTTTVIRTDETEEPDEEKKKKKKKKKEFSKLPDKSAQKNKADNSRDAAADTLRELFYNRGDS